MADDRTEKPDVPRPQTRPGGSDNEKAFNLVDRDPPPEALAKPPAPSWDPLQIDPPAAEAAPSSGDGSSSTGS